MTCDREPEVVESGRTIIHYSRPDNIHGLYRTLAHQARDVGSRLYPFFRPRRCFLPIINHVVSVYQLEFQVRRTLPRFE